MRQFFGMSQSGDLTEAVSGLDNPQFIMLMSNGAQFETHVKALEKLYPGVPSIGCIGMSYDVSVVEEGGWRRRVSRRRGSGGKCIAAGLIYASKIYSAS